VGVRGEDECGEAVPFPAASPSAFAAPEGAAEEAPESAGASGHGSGSATKGGGAPAGCGPASTAGGAVGGSPAPLGASGGRGLATDSTATAQPDAVASTRVTSARHKDALPPLLLGEPPGSSLTASPASEVATQSV